MKINVFLQSKPGVVILSVILGLGLACIFKMSCDSQNCIVYRAPDYSEKKIIKYNDKCYEPNEHMETCDPNKKIIEYANS
jgi:hypothetical protein